MRFEVKCADAVDEDADALICGANVLLNLSGGVGGELLRRYGPELQRELHALIADRAGRYAMRGEVFVTHSPSVPYRLVFHAVAVDGMYHADAGVVTQMLRECLEQCEREDLRKVIVTALGTGFGNLTMDDFCDALGSILREGRYEIAEVVLCVPDADLCHEARQTLRELGVG